MNRITLLLIVVVGMHIVGCNDKDDKDEVDYFTLLTKPTWESDSLLANGLDASGPDGVLVNFKGEAKFRANGTGTFGTYDGTWTLSNTQITITTSDLPFPIFAEIVELNTSSLKITTVVLDVNNPPEVLNIRMTFKAK
jgi:hypothetical protein